MTGETVPFSRRHIGPSQDDQRAMLAKIGIPSVETLIADLLSNHGEISGLTIGGQILARFAAMDDEGKVAFFTHLADKLGIDADRVRGTLEAFEVDQTPANYAAFLTAAEPGRQELARRLNRVPGATPQLVAMRKDLLRLIPRDDPRARIDIDFQHLVRNPDPFAKPGDVRRLIGGFRPQPVIDGRRFHLAGKG